MENSIQIRMHPKNIPELMYKTEEKTETIAGNKGPLNKSI